MRLLISNANILIDMEAGALMETLFLLPMQFGIPDLLYYEEIEPGSPGLEELGLQGHGSQRRLRGVCPVVARPAQSPASREKRPQAQSQRLLGTGACEAGGLHPTDGRRQFAGCCQQGAGQRHGHHRAAVRHDREPAVDSRRRLQGTRPHEVRQATAALARSRKSAERAALIGCCHRQASASRPMTAATRSMRQPS
jgi:hypothetical protein